VTIVLSDEYRIQVDSLNFLLEKKVKFLSKKDGGLKTKWIKVGHFSKIDQLLSTVTHNLMADDSKEYSTILEIGEMFQSLQEKVDEIGRECVTIFGREKWYSEFEKQHNA
jgi:hypothetical protein